MIYNKYICSGFGGYPYIGGFGGGQGEKINIFLHTFVLYNCFLFPVIAVAQAQPVYEIHHIIREKAAPKPAPEPAAPAPAQGKIISFLKL